MHINFIAGTNYSSAPSWLPTTLAEIATFYDRLFTNNITLDVTINWVPLAWSMTSTHEGGTLADNNLASGGVAGVNSSFSTVSSALVAHATNTTQNEAYSEMPSGVGNLYVAPAEAMVLGLETNQAVSVNLNVNSSANWLGSGGFAPLDAFAAISHEITETAMGRIGNENDNFGPNPSVMDMFRFYGSGVHDLTTGTSGSHPTAYFSIDNGATVLGTWNNIPANGDLGDWSAGPVPDDAYGSQDGGVAPISEVDLELMNVLGWSTDVVTSGNWRKISSGVTSSGLDVMSGGLMTVSSGAVASNTTYTDAQQFNDGVLAPASASADTEALGFIAGSEVSATVDGGGAEWVDFGGTATATTVNAGGSILNFGDTSSAVLNGGSETVESGGASDFTSVHSGATLSILLSGGGIGDHIASGGREIILGQTLFETVSAGGLQVVSAGGLEAAGAISGTQRVYGSATADQVAGTQVVESGGSSTSATISAGAVQTVSAGGGESAGAIDGDQYVYGVAKNDIVSGVPANQYVEDGGSAVSAVLSGVGFQWVLSGGFASATTVSSTTEQIVESGGDARNSIALRGGTVVLDAGATGDALTVSAGGALDGPGDLIDYNSVAGTVSGVTVGDAIHVDELELLSGGVASNVAVTAFDDLLRVDAGASATGTVLTSDASDTVFGSVTSTTVSASAVENIASGGEATATTVLGDGRENLASGAIGAALTVSANGFLDGPGVLIDHSTVAGTVSGVTVGDPLHVDELELLAGGVASNVTVTAIDDFLRVDSGANATGTVLESNASDVVFGTVTSTTVSSTATENVSSGGEAISTTVLGGGTENLAAGATGDALTISAGGVLNGPGELIGANAIFGAANGVTLGSGASETIHSGGAAIDTTVSAGAVDYVLASGTTTGTVVSSGGYELVSSGGVAHGTTLLVGGRQYVSSGGLSSATRVSSGGAETVLSAGSAVGTVLLSGGQEVVYAGGVAVATSISAGGKAAVESGGRAVDTTVSGGGIDYVLASGTTTGTVVSSGGEEIVSSGGFSIGTTISSGGTESVAGGKTAGTVVSDGGQERVSSGGVGGEGAVLSGGGEYVASGGAAVDTTVSDGGIDYVLASGTTTGTVVSSGGYELVSSGGVASATTLLVGGRQYVSSGGLSSATRVSSGGAETVLSAGSAVGTVLLSGGQEAVYAGGVAVATSISAGGKAAVESGGRAVDTTVSSGGVDYVLASGTATGTVVSSGGYEIVSSGGTVAGTTVQGGGLEDILSGGRTQNATVSGGGRVAIASGGGALGLTVLSGGVLVDDGEVRVAGAATLDGVLSGSGSIGQTAAGDLVLSGAGGAFSGRAVIDGGTIELASAGALGTGSVQFAAPATGSSVLQIDAAAAPAAGGTFAYTIVDFSGANEDIDLRSIAFVAGASATVAGSTLVLHDGGKTYTFDLGGSIAAAYPVLSDGHGGTLIDPRAAAMSRHAIDPRVVAMTHAMAAHAAPPAAAAPISRTTSSAESPFLHATASATAAHL